MASNNENRGVNIYLNANAADDTLKQLKASATKLRNELALLPRGSEEFAEKSKILDQVKDRLKSLRDEAEGTRESFFNLKGELAELAKLAIGATIGGSFIDVAKNIISQNSKLSDSFAGVMKTTGLTEVQVEAVNRSLQKIDTRTAKDELLGLAQVAGKLGYSTVEDVEGFVRAADKIGVALGEDLGGTEEAVNELGKLLDIFKVKDEFGIESGLLKVGSAINDLGASGTANEKNLIEFAAKLAGIAPAAKISLPNVLGMASVMDELGQKVQVSSTAIGQFITGLGSDVPRYAKIAGMDVQAFANLLRDDANEAMMRVLDASKNTGGGIAELAKNMKALDITGAEGRAAIGSLANNIDLLRQRQDEANQSFQDGTSITAEFDTVNNNLAGTIDKLSNRWATIWENSKMREWLTAATEGLIKLTD
ncbi:phage tail tape measure protein, partial [Sphingobacterium multivorum]|uniref:phage tail tape measure protein n=1 Tax=Sphingobacterium multivorum TaxID=28454 RepID=UPI0028A0C697